MDGFLPLTSWGDELSDSQRSSSARLHELHLGYDDVVLQHGAAAHADGVASRLVHIDVRAAAVLTHLGAHGDARRASKPDGKKTKHKDIKTSAANLCLVWNQNFKGRTFSCNLSISTVSHQYSPFSKVSEYSFSSSTVWYQYFYFVRTFNAL